MIPGTQVLHQAICTDCQWKGPRLGNLNTVSEQARIHETTMLPDRHGVSLNQTEVLDPSKMPEISEYHAKLIFIRENAQEAYETGKIKDATGSILKSIVELCTVSTMEKDDIGLHLGNLDKARAYLAAFTQGLSKGHANEEEPKIKAKRERERVSKIASKASGGNSKVNQLVEMAQRLAAIDTQKPVTSGNIVTKIPCPKCSKEVFSLKFHKC